ncbi:MAG: carboxypeptidase-like regulatory domain-containing protein, partial [Planctomycetota bacterium]
RPSTIRNRLSRGLTELRGKLDARPGGRESWMTGMVLLTVPQKGAASLTTLTLGSFAMWKIVAVASSVALLAWLGHTYVFAEADLDSRSAAELSRQARLDPAPSASALEGDQARPEDVSNERVAMDSTSVETVARPSVSGRLVGLDGVPLQGAEVQVLGQAQELLRTDDEGRFAIEFVGEAPSTLALSATADGYVRLREQVFVQAASNGALDVGTLTLDRAVELTGVVLDADDRPVQDAELRLVAPDLARLATIRVEASGEPDAVSAENGSFTVEKAPVGPWQLRVDHPSHPATFASGEAFSSSGADRVVIRLAKGGAIMGRVFGLSAEQDVWVIASRAPASSGVAEPDLVRRASPDASGSFAIEGLARDTEYQVAVVSGDDPRGVGEALSNRLSARVGDPPLQLRLETLPAIAPEEVGLRFRVLDAVSKDPITTCEISYRDGLQGLLGSLTRGRIEVEDGRFELDGLRAENVQEGSALRIEAPGYAFFELGGVKMERGRWTDLGDLELERAPTLRVQVVDDATSEPIAQARVLFSGYPSRRLAPPAFRAQACATCHGDASSAGQLRRTPTAPNSCLPLYQAKVYRSFEWEGQSEGDSSLELGLGSLDSLTGIVEHPDYVDVELPRADYRDGEELLVRLSKGGRAVVRVLEADGTPTAGLTVSVDGGDARLTDARGEATFENLAAGKRTFTASRQAQPQQTVVIGGATPPPTGVSASAQILVGQEQRLTIRLDASNSLTGLITERGVPLASAVLSVEPESRSGAMVLNLGGSTDDGSTRTRSDGTFVLEDVALGAAQLTITHPGRAMPVRYALVITPGENRVNVELPLAILEGVILDAAGDPIAGAEVRATGPGAASPQAMSFTLQTINADGTVASSSAAPGPPSVRTDNDGRFVLRGVADGVPLRIVATASGGRSGSFALDPLALDERRTGIRLTVDARGTLRLQVGAEGGFFEAFPSLSLQRLVDGEPDGPPRKVQGQGGFAVVDDLVPGEYSVVGYTRAGEVSDPVVVTVEAGRTKSLMVRP